MESEDHGGQLIVWAKQHAKALAKDFDPSVEADARASIEKTQFEEIPFSPE